MQIVQFTRTFATALVLVLAATGLWAAGGSDAGDSAAAAEKEMVLDPTTGKMVTAPEYGGTLTAILFNYPVDHGADGPSPMRACGSTVSSRPR